MYADDLLRPWWDALRAEGPHLELFDVHTRVGTHDPSGFTATADELRAALASVDATAAVFPLSEPDGYRAANDAVLAAAAAESGTRLVAFCRVAPGDDADGEARRCVAEGAAGIKACGSSWRTGTGPVR